MTVCICLHGQQTAGTKKRCSTNLSVAVNVCSWPGYLISLIGLPMDTYWPSRCFVFSAIFSPGVVPGMLWLSINSC